ncbi:Protein of unknown function (DUF3464) [Seminavis robusta]|uniref:Uncharacterized protein n=1 Tax=Seminavis robusta TaxID=568900 RepID=A0A9N8E523_9STRA|nr:Protein of unknown function (DUF3464) [Seminavis robusta]|eukprot:Sro677_g185850.1 Protein of unknown function (DUF3464) (304) ;mRNA; f:26168-27184
MTTTTTSWILVVLLLAISANTNAFQPVTPRHGLYVSSTELSMAKKKSKRNKNKGFGASEAATAPPKKESASFTPIATTPEPAAPVEGTPAMPNTLATTNSLSEQSDRTADNPQQEMNQGQKMLAAMRREQAEKKDADLRRVKEIREVDQMLQESPEAAAIPEKVAMRMGKRMLPFVGIPLFGSLGAFVGFWYFATYKDMEFQPGMVATTTIVILASGLLGITYSIVSASWDEEREGSLLGIDEFQKNVGNIKEGLDRSKENLLLREKMAGLPEAEIEAAISELEKREKRKRSFESKMGQELEQ